MQHFYLILCILCIKFKNISLFTTKFFSTQYTTNYDISQLATHQSENQCLIGTHEQKRFSMGSWNASCLQLDDPARLLSSCLALANQSFVPYS